MQGVCPLHHRQRPVCDGPFRPQRQACTAEGSVNDVPALAERLQNLLREPLAIHVPAGLGIPGRRALLRPQEEIVHMKHGGAGFLRKARGEGGFSGGTPPVHGDARLRVRADIIQRRGQRGVKPVYGHHRRRNSAALVRQATDHRMDAITMLAPPCTQLPTRSATATPAP